MLQAEGRRQNDEDSERLSWAWYVARLVRVKHMPSLRSLLRPASEAPPIEQSRADHAAMVAAAENN